MIKNASNSSSSVITMRSALLPFYRLPRKCLPFLCNRHAWPVEDVAQPPQQNDTPANHDKIAGDGHGGVDATKVLKKLP